MENDSPPNHAFLQTWLIIITKMMIIIMIRIIASIILIVISTDITIKDNGNNNDGEKICSKDKNY